MVMQIACVLKQGPEYKPEHVCALADSILAHNDVPIVCLSDVGIDHPGVQVKPLQHAFAGWWSKIELFRECTGPTLYLDIDTVVIDKLPPIGEQFTMLADVYRKGDFGSGVMSWQAAPTHIYKNFLKNPYVAMAKYRTRQNWGDQAFIRDQLTAPPQTFGAEYRSYKAHCRPQVPAGTRVVYFHGKPRPWDVELCLP
jgi:hypothetical protein